MALHNSIRDALPIKLSDRKFNIDVSRMSRSSVDPIRQGFDTQGQPGEQSLNQAGVWKRSRNDWELGAGQREADTPESNLRQYYTSLGIDPWTKNEIKLQKATAKTYPSSGTPSDNLFMCVADGDGTERVYVADNTAVYYSDNGTSWSSTNLTNPAAGKITAMATDGYYVYVASDVSTGLIQRIKGDDVSGTTLNTDKWVLDDVDGLWVANGYLMASVGSRLTVLSLGSAASTNADITSSTFSQVNEWKHVVGTPSGIYAGANQGDQGKIYYISVNDSTAAIDAPVIATELPMGETVNVLAEYSGMLLIGTNKGIRLASITGEGFLNYGPRINITNGVSVMEPQGEFVWFDWKNYDGSNTGLGRIGLFELTSPNLVPAYASDLMALTQGTIQGIVTLNDLRIFSVQSVGVYREQATYVTSGTINEGRFRWGVTELKVAASVDLRHEALATGESIKITVLSDDSETGDVTSNTVGNVTPGVLPILTSASTNIDGEWLQPTLTLTGPGGTTPTLQRWTLRCIPMPFVAEVITLPVILTNHTEYDNRDVYQDVYDDYSYIKSLLESRTLVDFKMGAEEKTVYVAGVAYDQGAIIGWSDAAQLQHTDSAYERYRWVNGILTVTLITVQTGVSLFHAS